MQGASQAAQAARFQPAAFTSFRFVSRSLDEHGNVRLGYALDHTYEFEERFVLPLAPSADAIEDDTVQGLLSLLHWVAGVSYYKAAVPPSVSCETGDPPPATSALLQALYSEGLAEFAVVNDLPALPDPAFPAAGAAAGTGRSQPAAPLRRVLVPVGGGKDSVVAIEIVRRAGLELALFSVGNARPIEGTASAAGAPRLQVTRRIDSRLLDANAAGALNGHVPVTAIVSAVALLSAALHGFDAVALANERSASSPNRIWNGVEVNHQFSKSARAERLLAAAVAEIPGAPAIFSILRPASELAIARAFARMPQYHPVFTSCNRVFKLDPALRSTSWCCDCDKCRFVFLILAPFLDPERMRAIFGAAMLDDETQFEGFARLTGTGGHKPFECVGEVQESAAAIGLLARDPRWRTQRVVARLTRELLPRLNAEDADPRVLLALSDDHDVPSQLMGALDAVLGA
ncbi:MAG: endonuclease domain-containing protein [Solirubrobacteraceae bacterium]